VKVLDFSGKRSEFPGGLHELDEVVAVINRGGHGGVVVSPLGAGDLTVTVLVTEVGEELKEHLILSHLTGDNLGVHVSGVHTLEVSGLDHTRTVSIELKEGLVNHSLSLLVEGSLNAIKVSGLKLKHSQQKQR